MGSRLCLRRDSCRRSGPKTAVRTAETPRLQVFVTHRVQDGEPGRVRTGCRLRSEPHQLSFGHQGDGACHSGRHRLAVQRPMSSLRSEARVSLVTVGPARIFALTGLRLADRGNDQRLVQKSSAAMAALERLPKRHDPRLCADAGGQSQIRRHFISGVFSTVRDPPRTGKWCQKRTRENNLYI